MLTELSIRNYLLFEELTIKGLRRVNLMAGKNNTGKTALLEALRILASDWDETVVNNILQQRGSFTPTIVSSYDALFYRAANGLVKNQKIPKIIKINEFSLEKKNDAISDPVFVVEKTVKPLKSPLPKAKRLEATKSPDFPQDEALYVPFVMDVEKQMGRLWDSISLTPKEDDVIRILKETVEPRLIRLDVKERGSKVRLEGYAEPLPLASLGDGVKRILFMAIALANAQGKMLLIDEFESGLHYSVQEKLWEMMFFYAEKWDIQIFITTHSEDTIRSFYYVASKAQNKDQAFFIRLQYDRQGKLETIPYDIDRLESALELNLEIR